MNESSIRVLTRGKDPPLEDETDMIHGAKSMHDVECGSNGSVAPTDQDVASDSASVNPPGIAKQQAAVTHPIISNNELIKGEQTAQLRGFIQGKIDSNYDVGGSSSIPPDIMHSEVHEGSVDLRFGDMMGATQVWRCPWRTSGYRHEQMQGVP
ncbi:hypothetical protein VNO78_14780 [Psophocarpus tetragonolobus]|uniref:Uncharacterized protein n=1 Tax=Psophocarpus tetragonolobus TaxID=3891 RepID=A0AAN9XJB2_PSOTE